MTESIRGESLSATDERGSQISAMFDGELPEAECELLSRRLVRDEALKLKWSRYALIGAAMRADPLTNRDLVARRVRSALESDTTHKGSGMSRAPGGWYKGVIGSAIAASVAAAAIMLLRVPQPGDQALQSTIAANADVQTAPALTVVPAASTQVAANSPAAPVRASTAELPSYVTPAATGAGSSGAQAQLANYIVAHSEYVTPFARLNRLSALATDSDGNTEQAAPNAAVPSPVIIESAPDDDADAVR